MIVPIISLKTGTPIPQLGFGVFPDRPEKDERTGPNPGEFNWIP